MRNTAVPGTRGISALGDLRYEGRDRHDGLLEPARHRLRANVPDQHHAVDRGGEQQRHVSAVGDLGQIGHEKGRIDDEECAGNRRGRRQGPPPNLPHRDEEKCRGHQHGCRDRYAVSRRQIVRLAEADRQTERHDHQEPVDGPNVDLTVSLFGRLRDLQPRQPSKLDRLPGHRVGARDDGLAGDDRRDRREEYQRYEHERRTQPIKNVIRCRRTLENECRLACIVEHETWKDERRPS